MNLSLKGGGFFGGVFFLFVRLFFCFSLSLPCGAGDESRQMLSHRCYRTYFSIHVLSCISKSLRATEVWMLQVTSCFPG